MNIFENKTIYYVALYERLSKEDGDKEESESIKNQSQLLKNFLNDLRAREPQNEFLLVDEYTDDGYSGTNFDRPDFQRMLNDIENHKVNLVIAKNLDRFGRYATEVIKYCQEYFPDNNIRFMTVLGEKIDTAKELEDIVPIKAILDEFYPRNLSRNIKAVKLAKAQQGLFQGNTAPYGYKKSTSDKHKLVIDDEVAPIIRKIFKMYAAGKTRSEIVDVLNSKNILPPRKYLRMEKTKKGLKGVDINDFSWKEITITKIIGNPVYIGTMVGAKTFKPNFRKKTKKTNKKENQIIVPNMHEPIIDIDLFNKCQLKREKHIHHKECKYDNIFKGLVYCR